MLILLFYLAGCNGRGGQKLPDVGHLEVSLDLQRFEEALFAGDSLSFTDLSTLQQRFPGFADCYLDFIVGLRLPADTASEWMARLQDAVRYPGFRACYDSVMVVYPNVEWLHDSLTQAFRYQRYYLPELPVPAVHTFVSEYSYGAVVCDDTTVGVGLDMFLGRYFTFYEALQFPQYLTYRMTPEHIPAAVMLAWAQSHLPDPGPRSNLLDHMIYYGKALYWLDLVLPHVPDHIKIGYLPEQLAWSQNNEAEIWAYFLDGDRLYTDIFARYGHWIAEGPTTQGMPPESPGKIGQWLGWQIVRAYAQRYPETSVSDLMDMQDAQALLDAARYKP